jgi:hypothetical protein
MRVLNIKIPLFAATEKSQRTGDIHWFGLKESLVFQAFFTHAFIVFGGFFQNRPSCKCVKK